MTKDSDVATRASTPSLDRIATTIRKLLRERGAGKSICPSEVARALDPVRFRALMPEVRRVAASLARAHEILVTQKGKPVNAETARGPVRIVSAADAKTTYVDAYRGIDFRAQPELYRVGRGEEGVLIAEPYKSELLPLWRFRTPEIARESSQALLEAFMKYREERDFVGMDMARKYLQMGFTRARRYANHRNGKKYAARDVGEPRRSRVVLPDEPDALKAEAASIFYAAWQQVERDKTYAAWRRAQRSRGDDKA